MKKRDFSLNDGILLHFINTEDKFKTNNIVVDIKLALNRETITKNALIPLVLRRGTANYPTMKDISTKLEEMYGASLDANSDKLGDNVILQFLMDSISNEYTFENSDLLKESIDLLFDIILNPVLEDGHFKKEYVEQEKESLKELINSKINDKATYAVDRAVEEMYKGTSYGLYKYGYVEDLEAINEKDLYDYYLEIIKKSEINIYLAGNFDEDSVAKIIEDIFSKVNREYVPLENPVEELTIAEPITVTEKQNVTQGKLVLGYKIDSDSLVEDFYKMTMYGAILGGTASSKLFNNVREKMSLAYTIHSQYVKHKGLLIVAAGIEISNLAIAKESILKEINDMKIGNITEEEMHDARVNLITRFKSFNDSQPALIGWSMGQRLLGASDDLDFMINKVSEITKEDIVEIASRLHLEATYFLTSNS